MRIVQAIRLFSLCSILALLSAMPAMAAMNAYMTLEGSKQGTIKGDGGSNQIKLISVARDVSTGMASGKRQHSPLVVTKVVDASSPSLAKALISNEVFKSLVLSFPEAKGNDKTAQKIEFTNVTIVSIRKSGGNEIITLDYQASTVTWVKGGISATDDWNVPR